MHFAPFLLHKRTPLADHD